MIQHLRIGETLVFWIIFLIFLTFMLAVAFPFVGLFWSIHLFDPFRGFAEVSHVYSLLIDFSPLIALALLLIIMPLTLFWLRHHETAALDDLIDGIGTTLDGRVKPRSALRTVVYAYNREIADHYMGYKAYILTQKRQHQKLKHDHLKSCHARLSWKRLAELGLCPKYVEIEGEISFYRYLQLFHPLYFSKLTVTNGSGGRLGMFAGGTSLVGDHYRSGHYRNTSKGMVYVRPHSVRSHTRRR